MMRWINRTLYDDTVTSQSLTYSGTSNRLTAIASQSVTTDSNGNITSIHGMTLAYDAHNRLSSATVSSTTTNYSYNGLGERVTKTTGSNIRHYFYGAQQQLLAEFDASGDIEREYIYLHGKPVVVLDHSGSGTAIYWIHNDHLGRPLALTDETGNVIWRLTNTDAFGNAANIDEDPDNNSANFAFNLRFPGQYFDDETGFHYNYLRSYDPATGRYIESDLIGLRGGLNTYLYGNANPIIFVDPMGLLSSAEAFAHYVSGSGDGLIMDFSEINTSGVTASYFDSIKGLKSAKGKCKDIRIPVRTRKAFSTSGDAALTVGNITLEIQGEFELRCDCTWSFNGDLSSLNDTYDFNKSTHRSNIGEALTTIGRNTPGTAYQIEIQGSRPLQESGKTEGEPTCCRLN